MLTNYKLKTLLVALPVITMMGCATGPTKEEIAAEEAKQAAAERAAAEEAARKAEAEKQAQAEAAAADAMRRAKEMMEREKAELAAQNTVYFDFDRSTIKPEFEAVLRRHADFLVKNRNQGIRIEGHTDSRGTPEYNIALGERRAKAVESFFRNAGVSSSQISVVSFGEEKPAVMGTSDYAFAQNRRAVVEYQ